MTNKQEVIMAEMFLKWIAYAMVIVFVSWVIPGITVANFISAMFVCVVLALINILVKPVLEFISLPVNFITFGMFSLVINAFLLLLAGKIAPGFHVESFLSAFLGSIMLALISLAVEKIGYNKEI